MIPSHSRLVRIESGEHGNVAGTKVFVDGIEQDPFVELNISMKVKNVAHITIKKYASVVFEGHATVREVVVCPACRKEMTETISTTEAAVVDTTDSSSQWVRRQPVVTKDEFGAIIERPKTMTPRQHKKFFGGKKFGAKK